MLVNVIPLLSYLIICISGTLINKDQTSSPENAIISTYAKGGKVTSLNVLKKALTLAFV